MVITIIDMHDKGKTEFHLGSYLVVYGGARRFDEVVNWDVSHQQRLEMARKSHVRRGGPPAVTELTGFYLGRC